MDITNRLKDNPNYSPGDHAKLDVIELRKSLGFGNDPRDSLTPLTREEILNSIPKYERQLYKFSNRQKAVPFILHSLVVGGLAAAATTYLMHKEQIDIIFDYYLLKK